jgi:hypothetical protein
MRTFQTRLSPRHAAAALALLMACQAHAGRFTTAEFGPARAEDVADLVTEAFTQSFSHDRWAIVLYSSVTFSGTGQPHCYAIAGVTPKGQDRFPVKSYSSHAQRMEPQSMTPGEQKEFAVSCARRAVRNMMSDEVDNMYVAPGAVRRGRP